MPRYSGRVNNRFILLTFAAAITVFAMIWAATAPRTPAAPVAAAAAPPVLYADCAAVRAAGAAPLHADQPGYRPALDPNMNGIACEDAGGGTATVSPQPGAFGALSPQGDAPPPPLVTEPQPDVPPPPPINVEQAPVDPATGIPTSGPGRPPGALP